MIRGVAGTVVVFAWLIGAACVGSAAAQSGKPNYATWGCMPHTVDGKVRFRAQARTAEGDFVAANSEPGTLTKNAFVVAGGSWDAEKGELAVMVLGPDGQRHVETAAGAQASPRDHLFTRVGGSSTPNNPDPFGMYNGLLAEVLIFNRLLTGPEQQTVEQYLAAKHFERGGSATSPPSVAGLVLQLDAAEVEARDGMVVRWPDRSGRQNHATGGVPPKLALQATPAGGPAIVFAAKEFLDIPACPSDFDGPARTWYLVFRAAEADNARILSTGYGRLTPDTRTSAQGLERMRYNHPGLTVDLGVGLWANPLPMDYDRDGKLDLLVASTGKPDNGVYLFEPATEGAGATFFKPGRKVSRAVQNLQVSDVDDGLLMSPGRSYPAFREDGVMRWSVVPYEPTFHASRMNQWKLFDLNADGALDLVVGADDTRDYGWDDAFDLSGKWTAGPLRGFVYWMSNTGSNDKPAYAPAEKLTAGGQPIETYGNPSPNFADFTGDGLPDLVCGEFLDKLTFFRNVGSAQEPKFEIGQPVVDTRGPVRMDLEMITPVARDWDRDGHVDLIVGEEDGRVTYLRHTGTLRDGAPVFEPSVFLQQEAEELKFGALTTPTVCDWNGDGRQDLLAGNTAGYLGWFENLGGEPTKWAAPKYLEANGKVIRVQAGENGSIQGPAEAKWGYTVVAAADWNHDGLTDLVTNSILGRVEWYENIGTKAEPKLAAAKPVEVEWNSTAPKPAWQWWDPKGNELVTQWRSSVQPIDLTGDGLLDLIALDADGYLVLHERVKRGDGLVLLPGERMFHVEPGRDAAFDGAGKPMSYDLNNDGRNDLTTLDAQGRLTFVGIELVDVKRVPKPNKLVDRRGDPRYAGDATGLRLNSGWAGRSGRRKFALTDWDGDGRIDLLVNGTNVTFFRNISGDGDRIVLRDMGPVDDLVLAGHDTCPVVADFDANGVPDLVVGAEDGFFYFMPNPRAVRETQR